MENYFQENDRKCWTVRHIVVILCSGHDESVMMTQGATDMTTAITDIDILPKDLREAVMAYVGSTSVDYTDADAMHGECWSESTALVETLENAGFDAWLVQLFDAPGHFGVEMAEGHYLVCVSHDEEGDFFVDLTCAQFPSYVEPRVTQWLEW